jgi:hypothetical protein
MKLSPAQQRRNLLKRLTVAASLILFCFLPARAQEELTPPKAEVRAIFGAATFGDGTEVPHFVGGTSARFYVTRRLSIEPELLYMRYSDFDRDYVLNANVAYDITDPRKKVVPYVGGGVGALYHMDDFGVFTGTSTSWTVNGGGGVKIFVSDRLFIAPEVRVGREPTVRATVGVGYVFSGRKKK